MSSDKNNNLEEPSTSDISIISCALISFCALPLLVIFLFDSFLVPKGPVNDLVSVEFEKNTCVKSFNGGSLEKIGLLDRSLILNYELEIDSFNMNCYEELISHMENVELSERYAYKEANINLSDNFYTFTIPKDIDLVNELNVESLIKIKDN